MKEKPFSAYVRESARQMPRAIAGEILWSEIPAALKEISTTLFFVLVWLVSMALFPLSIFFFAWLGRKIDRRVAKAHAELLRSEGWPEDEE
jgi:hypothetical protein